MAKMPMRPCKKPGCQALTRNPNGYCDSHQDLVTKARKGSESWHRWYKLDVWVKDLRPTQLLKCPWCEMCALEGYPRVRATVVDHIKPHRGNWALFVNRTNLQSLCEHHHNAKTMHELNELMGRGERLNRR